MEERIKDLTTIREDENTEYSNAIADDESASELVVRATEIIVTCYKQNDLMLAPKQ